jgi:hypothetical protein
MRTGPEQPTTVARKGGGRRWVPRVVSVPLRNECRRIDELMAQKY